MNDLAVADPTPPPAAHPARLPLRRGVLVLFGLALALVLALGIATIITARDYSRDQRWMQHTFQVREQILTLLNEMQRAEMEARSYGLTGQNASLQGYWRAIANVEHAVDHLGALTLDNPEQVTAMRQLRDAIAKRRATYEAILEDYRAHGAATAHADVVALIVNRKQLVRDICSGMLDREAILLQQRSRERDHSARLVAEVAGVALVTCIALVIMALLRIVREQRVRARTELALRDSTNRLQASLKDADEASTTLRNLARLAELLQSCHSLDEAIGVIERALPPLLPDVSGALALLNASRNVVEAVMHWGPRGTELGDAVFTPDDCWALRRSQAHPGAEDHAAPVCPHLVQAGVTADHTLCLPMNSQGQVSGVLSLASAAAFTPKLRRIAASAADQLALALANLQLQASLRTQSIRDPLTNLFNRRYLEASLPRELLRAERRQGGVAVLMLDLDHFKRYNDTQGHDAGDALLAAFGLLLAESCRGEDIPCRYGGEEFTMVLTEVDHAHALERAESIRKAVGELVVHYRAGTLPPATVSIGLASFPEHGRTPEALLRMADQALYRAKQLGRNRVASASDLPSVSSSKAPVTDP